jgi:hypothetical protein
VFSLSNLPHSLNVEFWWRWLWKVSQGRVVSIGTGNGLDDRGIGVRVPVRSRRSRISCSPCRPDRLWGPQNLLFHGYWRLFPRG